MAESRVAPQIFLAFFESFCIWGVLRSGVCGAMSATRGAEFLNSAGYRIVEYDHPIVSTPLVRNIHPQGAPLRDVKNLGKMRFNYSLLGGPIYGSDALFSEECVSPTYSVISVALDNAAPYPSERTPSTSTRRLSHPPAEIFKQSRTFKHLRKSTLFSWLDMLPPGLVTCGSLNPFRSLC